MEPRVEKNTMTAAVVVEIEARKGGGTCMRPSLLIITRISFFVLVQPRNITHIFALGCDLR